MGRLEPQHKPLIASAASQAIGGTRSAHKYYDRDEEFVISIARFEGSPSADTTTYSTVGLSSSRNVVDGVDIPTELIVVGPSDVDLLANVLSTAAFNIIKDEWIVGPGVPFPNVFNHYEIDCDMPHLVWFPPFEWEQLGAVEVEEGVFVHWLIGVPVHDAELEYLMEQGYHEFEARLESVDYTDLKRESVV